MPKAKPPAPMPEKVTRARSVQATVVEQRAFTEAAVSLAAKLGWEGEPHWLANGIAVRDAQRYCIKILHESYSAAAKGLPAPKAEGAAQYLSIDNANEAKLLAEALELAFQAGKDAPLVGVALKRASMDVEMSGSALSMLNKFLETGADA